METANDFSASVEPALAMMNPIIFGLGPSFQPISKAEDDVELAVCIACFIGEVRLIDNLIFMV
jgi:pantothenate synthetase